MNNKNNTDDTVKTEIKTKVFFSYFINDSAEQKQTLTFLANNVVWASNYCLVEYVQFATNIKPKSTNFVLSVYSMLEMHQDVCTV